MTSSVEGRGVHLGRRLSFWRSNRAGPFDLDRLTESNRRPQAIERFTGGCGARRVVRAILLLRRGGSTCLFWAWSGNRGLAVTYASRRVFVQRNGPGGDTGSSPFVDGQARSGREARGRRLTPLPASSRGGTRSGCRARSHSS